MIVELLFKLDLGDTLEFYVACYSGEGYTGWFNTTVASKNGNRSIVPYKDGIIYYKDLNGVVHECTMGYGKDVNGATHKDRYIQVKDVNGVAHSIDVYTTLYE